jgi:RNA polymerase sigma-70 factor (ECF subfamily)
VGNWLHGVALRTALKARAASSRRRARELQVPQMPEPAAPAADESWADLRPVLDEELGRLPDRYRAPVVLCYLEGKTNAEAARLLGCPKGTVLSRLAWARERLRRRLIRQGVALPVALVATALSREATATVPPALLDATVRGAMFLTTGAAGAPAAPVLALTEGVLRAMFLTRLKTSLALLLAAGVAACGVGALARTPQAAKAPPAPGAVAARPAAEAPARPADGQGRDEAVSVKALPPVVVRTVPQAGDTRVDAARTKEIRVTFSKDMTDRSWSWSQLSDETFPKTTGEPRYDKDRRTCVLPVKLEPGKTYALWLNSERFQNFKDADGKPAVPYLLVFETKP